MTPSKKQLDELFGNVAHDTPSLEHDELRSLLDKKISGALPMGPLQTSITKEDRKRGLYKKGAFIMALTAFFISTFLVLFNNNIIEHKKHTVSITTPNSVDNKVNSLLPEKKKSEEAVLAKDSVLIPLKFRTVNFSAIKPISIRLEDLEKIGLVKGDNDEILMYHRDNNAVEELSVLRHKE